MAFISFKLLSEFPEVNVQMMWKQTFQMPDVICGSVLLQINIINENADIFLSYPEIKSQAYISVKLASLFWQ